MNVHPIEKLLPQVADGVLVTDQGGTVILADDRAQAILGCRRGERINQPVLSEALAAVADESALPVHCELAVEGGAKVNATVVANRGGYRGYLVVLKDASVAGYDVFLQNVFGIIDRELRAPIDELSKVASAITRALIAVENGDDPQQIAVLMEIAVNVLDLRNTASAASRLRRIMSLAALYGDETVSSGERIPLPELLGDACQQLSAEWRGRGVMAALEMPRNEFPVIYGSRRWMLEGVVEAARYLASTADRGSLITIGLTRRDSRVLVHLRSTHRPDTVANMDTQREVAIMVARRVVEMHGGKLHQRFGLNRQEIVLEMPTGAPLGAGDKMSDQQVERYAQDIARLLATRDGARRSRIPAAS